MTLTLSQTRALLRRALVLLQQPGDIAWRSECQTFLLDVCRALGVATVEDAVAALASKIKGNPDRRAQIIAAHAKPGATLASVGRLFGITRQAVHEAVRKGEGKGRTRKPLDGPLAHPVVSPLSQPDRQNPAARPPVDETDVDRIEGVYTSPASDNQPTIP